MADDSASEARAPAKPRRKHAVGDVVRFQDGEVLRYGLVLDDKPLRVAWLAPIEAEHLELEAV